MNNVSITKKMGLLLIFSFFNYSISAEKTPYDESITETIAENIHHIIDEATTLFEVKARINELTFDQEKIKQYISNNIEEIIKKLSKKTKLPALRIVDFFYDENLISKKTYNNYINN